MQAREIKEEREIQLVEQQEEHGEIQFVEQQEEHEEIQFVEQQEDGEIELLEKMYKEAQVNLKRIESMLEKKKANIVGQEKKIAKRYKVIVNKERKNYREKQVAIKKVFKVPLGYEGDIMITNYKRLEFTDGTTIKSLIALKRGEKGYKECNESDYCSTELLFQMKKDTDNQEY